MRVQVPARIGKYELLEYLGGGMSEVYRGRDTIIGRIVAVKILTAEACADQVVRARFMLEAQMSGNLQHNHIVHIYDCGESENWGPYIVMEFLLGEDLAQAIQGGRTGDLRNKLRIALELAEALEHVHSNQIIHRDIKPRNVHITPNGAVKLMDFGIAKVRGFELTSTGYTLGTAYYMAPEQVKAQNVTLLVDIYGFGATLFELLTGARAVSGDSIERIFYCILNEPLDSTPLRNAGIPQPVIALVEDCVAKNPAARPQNFGAVRLELQRILRQLEPGVPAPPVRRFTTRFLVGVCMLIALLVATAALFALHPWRANAAGRIAENPRKSDHTVVPPVKQMELSPTLSTPTGLMVLVPDGTFLFGQDRRPVRLPSFYIDQTEVTNAAYLKFSQETGYPLPDAFPANKPDYPVVNIMIEDARQFATWAGKRLPTSQEWEKAARGTQGWTYPWGDEKDPTRANVKDNRTLLKHEIMPVNGFDSGASVFHAQQMVGNVWEFVDQVGHPDSAAAQARARLLQPPPRPEEGWYLIRGGSYRENLAEQVMYDSAIVPARWKDTTVGFRCVLDPAQR